MIRLARPDDRVVVETLLAEAGLPIAGVEEHFASFFVFEEAGRIVGAAGLELYTSDALLRSVVVSSAAKGRGMGTALTRHALDHAAAFGARAAYLLTTSAETYFPKLGFQRIAREELPACLLASHELRGACPASAIAMRTSIGSAGVSP